MNEEASGHTLSSKYTEKKNTKSTRQHYLFSHQRFEHVIALQARNGVPSIVADRKGTLHTSIIAIDTEICAKNTSVKVFQRQTLRSLFTSSQWPMANG